ncbi:MAG: sigma factor-like helix-turn-helix DNA-binding protein [Ignavibacteria bacterium]|nr:sigma factor-like helix-turn-helix DNA-binding protein [Ignavibacteria bacterium]
MTRSPADEILGRTPFFAGVSGNEIHSALLAEFPIERLFDRFTVRFLNAIRRLPHITTLQDLLNTKYEDFLRLRACGEKTINDARIVLQSLGSINQIELTPTQDELPRPLFAPRFLEDKGSLLQFPSDQKLDVDLSEFDFPVRFQTFLKENPSISKVKDLLEVSSQTLSMQKNLGKVTVAVVQEIMIRFLNADGEAAIVAATTPDYLDHEGTFKRLDDIIAHRIVAMSIPERNGRILLRRYCYQTTTKLTLEEIGQSFDLTKERVRQIVEGGERRITRSKTLFFELVDHVMAGPVVTNVANITDSLVASDLWSPDNTRFLREIIQSYFDSNLGFHADGDYILTEHPETLKKKFRQLVASIESMIADSRERVGLNDLLSRLQEKHTSIEADPGKLINRTTVGYLARKHKRFHVVQNHIYDEMLFQVHYGRYLKNVVYWSLKFLDEPVHFRQLAEFIHAHNELNREVSEQSVHSTLIFSKLIHDVDRGIFATIESHIPKRVTTWQSIQGLLRQRGALIEDNIYLLLRGKHSVWGIKMALENNRHKLIRVGNDLIDLKGDH